MDNELLKYAIDNGMIDLSYVQEQIDMNKRKEYLDKHPYSIWQGKDGKWRTYLAENETERKMVKRNSRAAVEDVVIAFWKRELENPTVQEVFHEWNDRRFKLNKITKPTQERNRQIFKRHYAEFGKRRIKSVTESEISDFLEEQISKHNLSAKAFSNLKSVTKGFLKRAKKRGLIDMSVEDMFADMDLTDASFKKTIKEDNQEVFDEVEMDKVFEYLISNLDVKNMGILLMFISGVRVGELVALKHSDFDGNSIKIRRTETRVKKESQGYAYLIKEYPKSQAGIRTIVVPESYNWFLNRLKMNNPFGEYIFCNSHGDRLTTNCIRSRMYQMCKKLNIILKSPHKARKTYGSILLDNNIDQRLIIGQMGHTNIVTTENHYHRNRRNIERKSEIISKIPEFSVAAIR